MISHLAMPTLRARAMFWSVAIDLCPCPCVPAPLSLFCPLPQTRFWVPFLPSAQNRVQRTVWVHGACPRPHGVTSHSRAVCLRSCVKFSQLSGACSQLHSVWRPLALCGLVWEAPGTSGPCCLAAMLLNGQVPAGRACLCFSILLGSQDG